MTFKVCKVELLMLIITSLFLVCGILSSQYGKNINNNIYNDYNDFYGVTTAYNINYDTIDQMYYLDMIALEGHKGHTEVHVRKNCTYHNYYVDTNYTSVLNFAESELYNYVKWSQIYHTNNCVRYKDFHDGNVFIVFGVFTMIVCSFCVVCSAGLYIGKDKYLPPDYYRQKTHTPLIKNDNNNNI